MDPEAAGSNPVGHPNTGRFHIAGSEDDGLRPERHGARIDPQVSEARKQYAGGCDRGGPV